MNLFEFTIFNTVLMFFPLLLYLIYVAYSYNIDKKENNLFLELALFSSLYLSIRYGKNIGGELPILMINIPLIIAYIKRRMFGVFIISLVLVLYYQNYLNYSVILLLIEYFLYFIIFIVKEKKKISDNIFIYILLGLKATSFGWFMLQGKYNGNFSFEMIGWIIIVVILLIVTTYLCLLMFKKGEDIIKLHMTIKELEKEKIIRQSIFEITHEIKNPIAVCKGYLEMFDVNNLEHSKKYVPIMKEEIARTLILLQDFLSIKKIKIEKDILDINLLLEEIVTSLSPLFKEKNIEIISNISEDEIFIHGDYNRLKQVFINVFKNSVEAMTNDRKHKLELKIDELDNEVKIQVIDNGTGISAEQLNKMKEPFCSTKQNGSGLGVYLSNEIIEAHSGILNFESDKKRTIVTIILPKGM